LIDNPDRVNEPTEVRVINVGQESKEYAGSKAIDIVEKLAGLATA
jgi:hypothetical protein